jgi:hypothetical protein
MKMGGFKRTVVLGMAASALLLVSGCRNERAREGQQDVQQRDLQGQQPVQPGTGGAGGESGENTGKQPDDLKQLPDEEGFQSVPEEQEAPSGIGLDGRGGGDSEHRQRDPKQDK